MDRLLCAASWRVNERVWDDHALIFLGGIADWQSRRTGGFETRERGGSGVDQPVRGGRRSGAHPGGKQRDERFIRRRSGWDWPPSFPPLLRSSPGISGDRRRN
jgi:hypothetical protein